MVWETLPHTQPLRLSPPPFSTWADSSSVGFSIITPRTMKALIAPSSRAICLREALALLRSAIE
ncbi:hypothetical protein IscW_ISCW009553 [Ixodes scapularis]|uniref:Uncharacterized protein n=1 Tax=Ixodes scapularis TaxID=6945 RepID=B7Q1H2_IXOSC|nr:hypothetical protein IscW_ISCW009553 [Ixodes scapularis]|eukprot:XP_002409619.1 hypothetical protein IscW_ISCW009553 [Ixodes scapularis]